MNALLILIKRWKTKIHLCVYSVEILYFCFCAELTIIIRVRFWKLYFYSRLLSRPIHLLPIWLISVLRFYAYHKDLSFTILFFFSCSSVKRARYSWKQKFMRGAILCFVCIIQQFLLYEFYIHVHSGRSSSATIRSFLYCGFNSKYIISSVYAKSDWIQTPNCLAFDAASWSVDPWRLEWTMFRWVREES